MSSRSINLLRSLRIIYQEIIRGYSYDLESELYFKHFNEVDISIVDAEVESYRKRIKEKGILTEDEKIQDLIEEKQWPLEKEAAFSNLRAQINDARKLIQATHDQNLVKAQEQLIKERGDQLAEITKEREELVGRTAEYYSSKKQSDLTIFNSLYIDDEFKEREFSDDEFEYLNQAELNEYVMLYNSMSEKFSVENIRRIAAMPFFLNKFFLSDNNPMTFFGKPVVSMTAFQVDLYAQGKMYKNILENTKEGESPPDDWYEDPDKLVEWYFYRSKGGQGAVSTNAQQSNFSKDDDNFVGGKSLVGAAQKDLRKVTGENKAGVVNLNSELGKIAKEKGGEWTMWDLLRLHGESVDRPEKEMKEYHKKQSEEIKKSEEEEK